MELPAKPCVICGSLFTPRARTDKTCSPDHSVQWRRQLARERIRRQYQPRPPRPDGRCECGERIPAPKTGPMPRRCESCKANREQERARKRIAVRRCYKCQTPLPEAARQPGKAVCDNCRVDPRKHRETHEQRRRLRKYGLTQEEHDRLWLDQSGRCAGCGSDQPGAKGWCIDHDHDTGRVRGILCTPCNRAIGFAQEDPAILRSLADWLEQQQREVKI